MSATSKAALTTDKLLASIRRRSMAPEANITFKDADLIEFLNEEMMMGLIPSILQMKDEYLVFKQVVPLIAQQATYAIPERAISNKLREISYSPDLKEEYNMTKVELDTKPNNVYLPATGTAASQFYVQGGDVKLHPANFTFTGYLYFYYYIRPNLLVKDSEVAIIKNINRTTGEITLDKIRNTYTLDTTYDFVKANSPHGIIDIEITATNINQLTKVITVSPDKIPTSLQIGDYMPLAGETCIPNVPTELHVILAQRVALRVYEALNDSVGLSNAQKKLEEMESKLGVLMDDRVEGSVSKLNNRVMKTIVVGRKFRGMF